MNAIIDIWQFKATETGSSTVLPDGCRDVIWVQKEGSAPELISTQLQSTTDYPKITQGTQMIGYRLAPGLWLDEVQLGRAFAHRDPDPAGLQALIEDLTAHYSNLDEAMARLALGQGPVTSVARDLGVSLQSLQRLLRRHSLRPPEFWLTLARARRAGREIAAKHDFAEIAYEFGYADQAHMSREIKRWFGVTPTGLKASPTLSEQLVTPGLAT